MDTCLQPHPAKDTKQEKRDQALLSLLAEVFRTAKWHKDDFKASVIELVLKLLECFHLALSFATCRTAVINNISNSCSGIFTFCNWKKCNRENTDAMSLASSIQDVPSWDIYMSDGTPGVPFQQRQLSCCYHQPTWRQGLHGSAILSCQPISQCCSEGLKSKVRSKNLRWET